VILGSTFIPEAAIFQIGSLSISSTSPTLSLHKAKSIIYLHMAEHLRSWSSFELQTRAINTMGNLARIFTGRKAFCIISWSFNQFWASGYICPAWLKSGAWVSDYLTSFFSVSRESSFFEQQSIPDHSIMALLTFHATGSPRLEDQTHRKLG